MTIDRRTVAFIVAHPLRSWRHVKACRAPWPELPATLPPSVYLPRVAAIVEAETIVDDEARRVAMGNHPAGKGRAA